MYTADYVGISASTAACLNENSASTAACLNENSASTAACLNENSASLAACLNENRPSSAACLNENSASSAACLSENSASSAACLLFWFYLMSCMLGSLYEISVHTCYFGSGKVKKFSYSLRTKLTPEISSSMVRHNNFVVNGDTP